MCRDEGVVRDAKISWDQLLVYIFYYFFSREKVDISTYILQFSNIVCGGILDSCGDCKSPEFSNASTCSNEIGLDRLPPGRISRK